MSNLGPFWTEEKIAEAARLWKEDGLSASQIARVIGAKSRNAVLSRLSRSGFLGGRRGLQRPKARPTTPKSRKRTTFAGIEVPADEPQAFRLEDGSFVTLMTASPRHCRWPWGDPRAPDFHYCGQDRMAGSPYCPYHTKRAWAGKKEAA